MNIKFLFILLSLLFHSFLYAQDFQTNQQKSNVDSIEVASFLKVIVENEKKDLIKSYLYIDKIERYSKNNNYHRGIIIAKKERALLSYNQRDYDDALLELQNGEAFILEMNLIEQARFYNLKGSIFQKKGKIDSSLFYLNKSLKIYEKTKSAEGIISSLTNIGISLYESSGLTEEVLKHFENAYNLCLQLKDYKRLPEAMNNYAVLLLENGETKKAVALFNSLFKNKDLDENPISKSTLLLNWASYQKISGHIAEAFTWYQKSLAYSKSKNIAISPNIYWSCSSLFNQGRGK